MHILFLARWFPYPANHGAKVRAYNIITQLARAHTVSMASFAEDPISPDDLREMGKLCANIEHVPYRSFDPHRRSPLSVLLSAKPRWLHDAYSQDFMNMVKRMAERHAPDLIVASNLDTTEYPLALPGIPRMFEEIETGAYSRQYREETRPLPRMRKWLMWRKLQGYVRQTLQHYPLCTVVSQPEFDAVSKFAPGYRGLTLVPNGADLKRLTGRFAESESDRMVFAGALTYHVNFDAMRYFIGEILPLIAAERPSAKLYMSGRTNGVDMTSMPTHANAIHAGHQQDIRPFVQRATVSVVPERLGGGTRIKILESLALGTPVVSNRNSALGLDLRHEYDVLIAETPREFADAVLRVLGDPNLRQRLSANGRATVERAYDWNVIGDSLNAAIARTYQQRPG